MWCYIFIKTLYLEFIKFKDLKDNFQTEIRKTKTYRNGHVEIAAIYFPLKFPCVSILRP